MKRLIKSSPLLPQTGIDTLLNDGQQIEYLKGKKVALLANQSSITSDFISSAYALQELIGPSLISLFTLEHGWSAFCAAGEAINNTQETYTKLPIYSLYGPLFKENLCHLKSIDILIIDVQDVGVRCYTYMSTCAKVLEYSSLEKDSLEFIVCDRPNPLGNAIRGPEFNKEYRSLVNYVDVPFQHGKTIGTLLKNHNNSLQNPLPLSVIPYLSPFHPDKSIWIPPSPGLPDWEATFLYPGLVLLEGTNISEGRGSSLPFKCVAAPLLDFMKFVEDLNKIPQNGIQARPFSFIPDNGKLSGQLCHGAQLHVMDYEKVNGLFFGVSVLHILFHSYPPFEWTSTHDKYWIDELTGGSFLREAIERGNSPQEIYGSWKEETALSRARNDEYRCLLTAMNGAPGETRTPTSFG